MRFIEDTHQYVKNGKYYRPVTSIISNFIPEFKSDVISKAVAKKEDRSQDEVLDEWRIKRDIGCHWGDSFHLSAELWIKHNTYPKQKILEEFVNKLEEKVGSRESCESEVMVWSDDLHIAGTIDIVHTLSEPESDGESKEVELIDIKTNKELNKSHNAMKEPFEDWRDSKINKYTLQLNIYRELISELQDVDVKAMKIYRVNFEEGLEIEEIEVEKVDNIISAINSLNLKVESEETSLLDEII
ncbi:MAG: PD-(D/E)XK nuclease family protein [Elusimicrobiota bacterium]